MFCGEHGTADYCPECAVEDALNSKWINAEAKTPENDKMVVAFCTPIYGDSYVTGCYFSNEEYYDQGRTVRVSLWQEFPEAPTGV